MTEEIKDYDIYNSNMAKSMLDKVFFMDKIEVTTIVDFGCANGTLIEFLSKLFPDFSYVGYDIDESMLDLARNKCPKARFFSKTNEILDNIDVKESAVVLSSVIHEVYAYGTKTDVDQMWKFVYHSDFKNIVIRDMIPSVSMEKPSDINDYTRILRKADSGQVQDFVRVWGSLEQNRNLIHYLLKYRYTDNWRREVKENYFPLSRENLLAEIPDSYQIEFHEHFVLPYFKRSVMNDFGIQVKDSTHLKIILERKS